MKTMNEYDKTVIGANLRKFREAKGLSRDEVRQYLWLGDKASIYQYEAGVKMPQAVSMLALMQLYEITAADLVERREEDDESSSHCFWHLF